MTLELGVLALLQAKPGKEAELAAFLEGGRAIVAEEPATRVWYAFQVDGSTFGIFDAFEDEADRQEHLNGRIPAALGTVGADLLAAAPDIRLVDVLAVKDPA
ncbi:antibiotic biosynthesis monooxygenase [Kitasatospora nipponensis]|uniref:Antibiotic biosynthesis monooxygenase n=1 Tax=Kitasatospora nipponensis TaxID=258049 RepID=A0ABN1WFQ0_9ACTN